MRRDILRFSALCGWTSLDAAIILLDGKLCASPFYKLNERNRPSMPSAALRRLSPLQWAGLDLGLCAVALLLLGGGVPASPFFFPLLSLWACLVLFVLAVCVLRTAGVELVFFHWAVVFGIWAVAVV